MRRLPPSCSSVRRFLHPADRACVIAPTQSQHWLGADVLNVPVLDAPVAARFLVSRAAIGSKIGAWKPGLGRGVLGLVQGLLDRHRVLVILGAVVGLVWQERNLSFRAAFSKERRAR